VTDHNETWDEIEKLRNALRNCLLLAMRKAHRDPSSDWTHIIRFCKEGGVEPSPLRAAQETGVRCEKCNSGSDVYPHISCHRPGCPGANR